MPHWDLTTADGLKQACALVEKEYRGETQEWVDQLSEFLDWVVNASEAQRGTLLFQRRLWDENPVSSPGQGNISVSKVIEDPEFTRWLARRSVESLPSEPALRISALRELYEQILERMSGRVDRTPHLKTFRVLAAFFPRDFTTIAHRWKLHKLAQRMGGASPAHPVDDHAYVLGRMREVLGPVKNGQKELAWRMAMAWYLYELVENETPEEDRLAKPGLVSGDETLLPLPAARRRRGMTAVQGGLATVLGILEFCKQGATREDLLDQIQTTMPGLKDSSRRVVINVLQSELGVIKRDGDGYRLTEQGSAVLESGEASELGNWLLTRILGVDHVLKRVQSGPTGRSQLVELLQRVNPGWTTTFAPNALINWLISLGALSRESDGAVALTSLGSAWAARIAWTPEFLASEQPEDLAAEVSAQPAKVALPSIEAIASYLKPFGTFPRKTVERLHIGLWPQQSDSSARYRHFAVLTGISGSGKTLLARRYAQALNPGTQDRLHIEAVQPGWYDPTPLLGYLNPLRSDTYSRTPFLNFLLRACQDPEHAYVAILDEMNLSHPEQYFAPLLSAMETQGKIKLHAEQNDYDGIPPAVDYPANLAIIGTVNMDETTYGLSDKVLDRAFTLEFWDIDVANYPRWGQRGIPAAQEQHLREILDDLMHALSPARLHFGWRVIDDVLNYVQSAKEFGATSDFLDLVDSVVYAKVLPKLRGDENHKFKKALDDTQSILTKHGLSGCAERVKELRRDLEETGSARFWR